MRFALILLTVTLIAAGCGRKSETATTATDTIAPAAARPQDTSTEEALTQTVDVVEDNRAENDGGVLTATATSGTTVTTTTVTATSATTATTGTR